MTAAALNPVLLGCIATLNFVAGLLFLRFWLSSRDRFFLYFVASFWIEGALRFYTGLAASWSDDEPFKYLVRLLAYGLIMVAILDKNRPRR